MERLSFREIKKLIEEAPRSVAYEWIVTGEFDEADINLAKTLLLYKYIDSVCEIDDGYDPVDLAILNYCYTTATGKEAADAKKKLRKKLVQKVAYQKRDDKAYLFEEDGGLHYSRWCTVWAKEQERHFSVFFGKDPRLWLQKIREKFEIDCLQAEKDKII